MTQLFIYACHDVQSETTLQIVHGRILITQSKHAYCSLLYVLYKKTLINSLLRSLHKPHKY